MQRLASGEGHPAASSHGGRQKGKGVEEERDRGRGWGLQTQARFMIGTDPFLRVEPS